VDLDACISSLYSAACVYAGRGPAEGLVARVLQRRPELAAEPLEAHRELFETAAGAAWRSWTGRIRGVIACAAHPRRRADTIASAGFAALPPLERAVLYLCDGEGLDYDQIAAVTALDRDAVARRVSRGRRRLRRSRSKA
jgi:DNA-directed RNA polymerase specialized sigma24 family protein